MAMWQLYAMPVIGGLIGWSTNVIAIKMIFHPRREIRIPLLAIKIQGLLPKRHAQLASNVGKAVEEELLPIDTLLSKFETGNYRNEILFAILNHVKERLAQNFPRLLPDSLRGLISSLIENLITREFDHLMDRLTGTVKRKIQEDIRIGELVEEKIMQLDLEELERLVFQVAHAELRHIELLGAVVGFIVGLGQALLLLIGRSW